MTIVPYPYQERGVQLIEKFDGRVLLADEMGLGKTPQSLWWCKSQPYLTPIIVVCPASLKYNWEREAVKYLQSPSVVLSGRKCPQHEPFPKPRMFIINYDILMYWVDWLKKLGPLVCILDECHYLGSTRTRRTKAVRQLCKEIPFIIALSGTPLVNRPSELWPVLNILWPQKYPTFFSLSDRHCFANRFCQPKRTPWGWTFNGATNLNILHEELKRNGMIRRKKKDVLTQLPTKSRHVVPVAIEDEKQYEKAEKEFLKWLREIAPHKVRSAARAERLVQMGYLKRLAGKLKITAVLDWIKLFFEDTAEKLIVFGVHKLVLGAIKDAYPHVSVIVDGSVTGRKRQEAVDKFNKAKNCKLFIGNIQAAGAGWSANDASNVLFAELDWTPGKHTQAEDRVHGLYRGGGKHASSFYLVGKGTIEEDLCEIIQKKQGDIDQVMDGAVMKDTLSIYDMLEERLKQRMQPKRQLPKEYDIQLELYK